MQQSLHLAEEMLSGTGIHIPPNMYLADKEKRIIVLFTKCHKHFFICSTGLAERCGYKPFAACSTESLDETAHTPPAFSMGKEVPVCVQLL